jgi:hypothetical protein
MAVQSATVEATRAPGGTARPWSQRSIGTCGSLIGSHVSFKFKFDRFLSFELQKIEKNLKISNYHPHHSIILSHGSSSFHTHINSFVLSVLVFMVLTKIQSIGG